MEVTNEKTEWGTVWKIQEHGVYRFAVYIYDDDPETLYLSNVFVDKGHRGKGLGNKILSTTDELAKKLGTKQICLRVKIVSNAYEWYKRHGYKDLSEDDEENGYIWLIK